MDKKISPSLEDYLEAIYCLDTGGNPVRITDIAASLLIAKPSVTKAVNALKDKGYALKEPYGGVVLTEKGVKTAKKVLQKHRMLTRFLTEVLKVAPETAARDACAIEHVISEETFTRLTRFMAEEDA